MHGAKSGGRAMAILGQKSKFCLAAAVLSLGLAAIWLPHPASAGFFDRLFGDVRRAVEGPRAPAAAPFVDPFTSLANHFNPSDREQLRADTGSTGPSKAFCVRTCDGHFFPVQGTAGISAAASCRSFCPASETKVFGGSNIDTATANDGGRYADLPNAFLYRKAMVASCTCNGKSPFGLARLDAASDPTLRPGDIVATKSGLAAFTGMSNNAANFTPIENYARLSKTTREKLAETKVMGPAPGAPASDITSAITPVNDNLRDASRGQVQFAR
ncbi:unnamed protein product [Phaeothamnion confervicola]